METYKVESGNLSVSVRATNHKMAAIKAIEKSKNIYLGELTEVLKESDNEETPIYINTESLFYDMGIKIK